MSLQFLQPVWSAPARVQAAFSWREGGVSVAPFESLNPATHVGDVRASVEENRRRLCAQLQLRNSPLWLEQVHGTAVVDADADGAVAANAVPVADAAVTRQAQRPLAIMVADCLPVLFASDEGAVIAAAHAGWRGLVAGVLENAVAAMQVSAGGIYAWFGPCIRQPRFEVGDEVRQAFLLAARGSEERAATSAAFEVNARGRWQCDLPALARLRLARLGLTNISDCGVCSFDDPRCFSHRRDGQTGRMAALIWLQA